MSLSAIRVAVARENIDEAPLTPEEQLMVAPPDEAAQDPDVAVAMQEDSAAMGGEEIIQLLDDGAAMQDVVDTVRAEGEDIKPETVMIAQERLNQIGRRYGFSQRKVSRENFEAAGPYSEAQDLIADAEKNLEYIKVAANEGLRELGQRLAVNWKNFFKWRHAYLKDAFAVVKAAQAASKFTPNPNATYTSKVRIAHFTDANQNVLTTASALGNAMEDSLRAMRACRVLQDQFERVFVFFSKGNGRVDLSAIAKAFDTFEDGQLGKCYSMAGKAGIYGEDIVMYRVNLDGATDSQEALLEAFANTRYQHIYHWRVKHLEDQALPAMSAEEVAKNAQGLINLARNLKTGYDILDSLVPYVANDDLFNAIIEAISNPKMFFKFRNVVRAGITAMYAAGDMNVDLKAKAFNCLLDYYKWSLKQNT